ncbi:MAG: PilZ domain-containing protein [Rhodocyclaceae bacterium]|nr:MAG: PilZ domain-containing protein [Rhodocyclaceae bacterium]
MEKRHSERVQFFNARDESGIQPVWVFRQTRQDSILGLLVDISNHGVQIITSRDAAMDGDMFQLVILDESEDGHYLTTLVNRRWHKDEGTLYLRHGFSFEEEDDIADAIHAIVAAGAGLSTGKWLRCELIDASAA